MDILLNDETARIQGMLDKTLPYRFMRFAPKQAQEGDRVYLYDASKGGIVGLATIQKLNPIDRSGYKLGCYPFMVKYISYVLGDEKLAKRVKRLQAAPLPNYTGDIKLYYIYDEDSIDYIEKNASLPNNPIDSGKRIGAINLMEACDVWLLRMGYYNWDSKSACNCFFEFGETQQYSVPLSVDTLCDKDGNKLTSAPKLWKYVRGGSCGQ